MAKCKRPASAGRKRRGSSSKPHKVRQSNTGVRTARHNSARQGNHKHNAFPKRKLPTPRKVKDRLRHVEKKTVTKFTSAHPLAGKYDLEETCTNAATTRAMTLWPHSTKWQPSAALQKEAKKRKKMKMVENWLQDSEAPNNSPSKSPRKRRSMSPKYESPNEKPKRGRKLSPNPAQYKLRRTHEKYNLRAGSVSPKFSRTKTPKGRPMSPRSGSPKEKKVKVKNERPSSTSAQYELHRTHEKFNLRVGSLSPSSSRTKSPRGRSLSHKTRSPKKKVKERMEKTSSTPSQYELRRTHEKFNLRDGSVPVGSYHSMTMRTRSQEKQLSTLRKSEYPKGKNKKVRPKSSSTPTQYKRKHTTHEKYSPRDQTESPSSSHSMLLRSHSRTGRPSKSFTY